MKERRAIGVPLPRQTASQRNRRRFGDWLSGIVASEPLGCGSAKSGRIEALADQLERKPAYISQIVSGDRSPGPEIAWEIGWGLRSLGVSWISGPVALAVIPEFEGHVLGVSGEVLERGPSQEVRRWWPTIAELLDTSQLTYGTVHLHRYSARDEAGTDESAVLAQADLKKLQLLRVDDSLARALHSAWLRWWGKEQTAHLAPAISILIELLRLKRFDQPEFHELLRDRRDALVDWARYEVPHHWDAYGPYLRPKKALTRPILQIEETAPPAPTDMRTMRKQMRKLAKSKREEEHENHGS